MRLSPTCPRCAIAAFDQQDGKRRPHAGVDGVLFGCLADLEARLVHRVAHAFADDFLGVGRGLRIEARLVGVLAAEQDLLHGFHRDGARDLAGGVAPHSVRDQEQTRIEIDEKAVLVPFANGAGVGAGMAFELHGIHGEALKR